MSLQAQLFPILPFLVSVIINLGNLQLIECTLVHTQTHTEKHIIHFVSLSLQKG